jgi:hypothetical protein
MIAALFETFSNAATIDVGELSICFYILAFTSVDYDPNLKVLLGVWDC